VSFLEDLAVLGFREAGGRGAVVQYALRANPFLTYWVHHDTAAETLLFTWEHAIGEYVSSLDLQIGANEELNQFLFPKHDVRGPVDIRFVTDEMDRVEAILRGVDLTAGVES
jgi:hypothetical protein